MSGTNLILWVFAEHVVQIVFSFLSEILIKKTSGSVEAATSFLLFLSAAPAHCLLLYSPALLPPAILRTIALRSFINS